MNMEMKTCIICKIDKPLDEYYLDTRRQRKHLNRPIAQCKSCKRKDISIRGPKLNYKKRYNLSIEQIQIMLKQQNNSCEICKTHIHLGSERNSDEHKLRATAFVDHNHTHGYIRGLLCHICNASLGGFKDSKDILMSAHNYLLHHESLYNEKQQQNSNNS